jgi:hypothetical protein
MASIIVMRKHVNHHVTAGFYLVDMLALGIKDTHFQFNIPEWELQERVKETHTEEIPYVLAHNIIYGAEAFASEHGLQPHKDFKITQYILEEDTDDIELIDIEFGEDGKPVFINDWEEDDKEDWNEDEEEQDESEMDYASFTDEEWRLFLTTRITQEQLMKALDALFEKWLMEKHPLNLSGNEDIDQDALSLTDEPINTGCFKSEREQQESTSIFIELNKRISRRKIIKLQKKIQAMSEANPDNPVYYNQLVTCAAKLEDENEFNRLLYLTIEKFPDYLFGKMSLANEMLDNGKMEEAESLLQHSYSLKSLCPGREVFHYSEAINFHSLLLRIFTLKKNMLKAKGQYDFLCTFDNEYLETCDLFLVAETSFVKEKINVALAYAQEKGYVPGTSPN